MDEPFIGDVTGIGRGHVKRLSTLWCESPLKQLSDQASRGVSGAVESREETRTIRPEQGTVVQSRLTMFEQVIAAQTRLERV